MAVKNAAPYFGIEHGVAQTIVAEVATAVAGWRRAASRRGLGHAELDRMASAFEHEDLARARKL